MLQLKKNLYGLKDAGRTWWEHLSEGLLQMGFKQCQTDQCVFYKDDIIILIYVDDCCIISKNEKGIQDTMNALKEHYTITDEGEMDEYLGIKLEHSGNQIRMTQPLLIDRIIEAIPRMKKANPSNVPAHPSVILTKDEAGAMRKEKWHYRSLIGMLNFLVNSTRPEIAYAVHKCARLCEKPKLSHEKAVKKKVQYLIGTRRSNGEYSGLLFILTR